MNIEKISEDAGQLETKAHVLTDQVTVLRTSDDQWAQLRATRDGAPIIFPWKLALTLEGRVFHITVGAFSTPVGDGGVIDLDQPEFTIAMPANQVLIPFRVSAQMLMPFIDFDSDEREILFAADRTQTIVNGTATAEVVFNMRTDNPRTSAVTARSAYSANSTAPTLDLELARIVAIGDIQGAAANAHWNKGLLVYEPTESPFLVGPSTLIGYWGGSVSTTGFGQAIWAELPLSAIS